MREYTKKPENQSRTLESNPRAFKQAPISDILQAYKNGTLGKQPIQRENVEDEELLQGKLESDIQTEQEPIQREEKSNNTGLPNNLKTGIENFSGFSMDDVKVHYNSDKPAQLNALAYAQGTDIHVAPGQEQHLPHEAWHVVQQKQGRVQPTMQLQGVNVNDNEGLEREADMMGKGVMQRKIDKSNLVTQLEKKIIGERDALQTRLIGVNLMPAGGIKELLPYNRRGYDSLSNKIAGHTSIISGYATSSDKPMTLTKGRGFSPDGFFKSMYVGMKGLMRTLGLPSSEAVVSGNYHSEGQSIVNDKKAKQLLIRVTPETQEKWEQCMGDEGSGGIYSYAPGVASQADFAGNENDNCTTVALRNAMNICIVLIDEPGIPEMDKINLRYLHANINQMVVEIVHKNTQRGTTVGTQGRAIGAFDERLDGSAQYDDKDFDSDDGFGLFLDPSERW